MFLFKSLARRQMTSNTYRNIIYSLVALTVIFIIALPEMVLEFFHFIFELLYELADVSFEGAETLLDHVVEHLFETELHETQTIVFYILMSIIAFPAYYLGRILIRLFFRIKNSLPDALALYKTRATIFWRELSLNGKIKFIVIAAGALYLSTFLFM